MAELDQVYGSMNDENEINNNNNDNNYERQHNQVEKQNDVQMPNIPQEYQQPQYNVQQQQIPKRQYMPSYSFWDRMTLKRSEVIKLAMFSLVILLAIALDKMCNHYLTKYISENVLSDTQEFIIRFTYPIIVFLILWIAKSL